MEIIPNWITRDENRLARNGNMLNGGGLKEDIRQCWGNEVGDRKKNILILHE